jgi:hypothetical protein
MVVAPAQPRICASLAQATTVVMTTVMAARLAPTVQLIAVTVVVVPVRIMPTVMTITFVLMIVAIVGHATISTTRTPATMDSTAMGLTPARAVVVPMPVVPVPQVRLAMNQPILVRLVCKIATVTMVMFVPPTPATVAFANMPTTQPLVMMVSIVTEPIPAWAEAAKYTLAIPVLPMKPVTKPPTLAARLKVAADVPEFPCAILISVNSTARVLKAREIVIPTRNVLPA